MDSNPITSDAATADTLADALARHSIELSEEQIALVDQYARLLWDWNEKINLTRHTSYEKFVSRDLVDSQWLEKYLDSGARVLDLGTGGGVPGILLAILRPDLKVTLCESVAKKARVVAEIVGAMKLSVKTHHARAEELLATERYDTIVARAVAPISKLLTWLNPHWDAFDRLLIIKGPAWVEERGEARNQGQLQDLALRKLASYPLPGTESESVVLSIRPKDAEGSA